MQALDIENILANAVAEGVAPGLSAAVSLPDQAPRHFSAGVRGMADATPMGADTVFWIASCTKAIVAAAALQLVERGLLDLDAPVGALLPELAAPSVLAGFDAAGEPVLRPARTPVTLRALLTHTSGLAYDFFHADLARYLADRDLTMQGVGSLGMPLVFDPGEGWQYGTGIDAAGLMIEAVTGRTLGEQLAAGVFEPLGMADTTFDPTAEQDARRAGLHMRQADGSLQAIDPIPPTQRDFRGGGGLYATAPDYLKFLRAILDGGGPILSPTSAELLTGSQTSGVGVGNLTSCMSHMSADFRPFPGEEKGWTLGFLRNASPVPGARAAGSLAWGGLANCYYWADPANGVAGVLFAQFLPFADSRMLGVFDAFERAVYSPERSSVAAKGLPTEAAEA